MVGNQMVQVVKSEILPPSNHVPAHKQDRGQSPACGLPTQEVVAARSLTSWPPYITPLSPTDVVADNSTSAVSTGKQGPLVYLGPAAVVLGQFCSPYTAG